MGTSLDHLGIAKTVLQGTRRKEGEVGAERERWGRTISQEWTEISSNDALRDTRDREK